MPSASCQNKEFAKDFDIEIFEDKYTDVDIVHYPSFDLFYHTLPIFKNQNCRHSSTSFLWNFRSLQARIESQAEFVLTKIALSQVDAVLTDSFIHSKYSNVFKYSPC